MPSKMVEVYWAVRDIPAWLRYLYDSGEYTTEELDEVEEIAENINRIAREGKRRELPGSLSEWLEIFPEGAEMISAQQHEGETNLQYAKSLPIDQVIKDYAKLIPNGYSKWKCSCPLHKEKTPSMVVFKETNKFYCYGCHEGGDTIDFISKLKGLSFNESVKLLCQTNKQKESKK